MVALSTVRPSAGAVPDPRLRAALTWQPLAGGVAWADLELEGSAPAWRTRLIVVRIDPRRVRFSLEMGLAQRRPPGVVDRSRPARCAGRRQRRPVPDDHALGLAGHERHRAPRPGDRPALDRDGRGFGGRRSLDRGDSLADAPPAAVTAFQSYPTLLQAGLVPGPLRVPGAGVDLEHRDARLAIGGTRDGQLLIVMTRYATLGEVAEALPIGPTTPEMAAILGALGAVDAVMLDGGISAQMILHDPSTGQSQRWHGWRKVPWR